MKRLRKLLIDILKAKNYIKRKIKQFILEDLYLNNDSNDLSGFFIDEFLPDIKFTKLNNNIKEKDTGKIKVRFINHTGISWNSIRTICSAFQSDELFEVLIIGGGICDEITLEQIRNEGYQCVKWDEYNVENDLPDILILNHPYDRITQIKNCREYCKLIIVASMQLIRYCYNMKEFWYMQKRAYGIYQPDYYLFDSLLYNEIMQSKYASEQIIEMGNAKFDGIYNACKEKHYEESWMKLKNKKVILWTTDHGIYDECVYRDLTFDLYAKTIFDYAKKHREVGIVFRPHKTFIYEMLKNRLWSEYDLKLLKKYCHESLNIVYDDNLTYDNAFSIADGIIADGFCGITCSALPTLKPVCLTYRQKEDISYHPDLAKCYYSAYSGKEIVSFIEMVKNGQDSLIDIRKQACKKYVKFFDGKNGKRIKEFVYDKFSEMNN